MALHWDEGAFKDRGGEAGYWSAGYICAGSACLVALHATSSFHISQLAVHCPLPNRHIVFKRPFPSLPCRPRAEPYKPIAELIDQ